MSTKHLLFELGSEELPPKTLIKLSEALLNNVVQGLTEAELSISRTCAFATPRRLAILIEDLSTLQPDKKVEKRGPAIQAAFMPDGKPSKAAEGFAASCGTSFEQLERLKTEKGEWLVFNQTVKGQATEQLIPDILRKSIAALPIAKRMRWGSFATEFVRPVHWAVLLFGQSVIECEILGLTTGSTSVGHRFHAPKPIALSEPKAYEEILYQQGKVIVDIQQRKAIIREKAEQAATAAGGIAHIEEDLLEEIAALNEWPIPVTGAFDARFLALPAEVLITTMQTNQKYFPVKSASGGLLPFFITFSNIESIRPESIKEGNERVITPRLTDAEFFWNQDRKRPLSAWVNELENVVFQERLGTLADKKSRLEHLSAFIAGKLNANVDWAIRAAGLAKADLLTSMVGEFGNLQGIMGRYYAQADGEHQEVSDAIEQHYFPKQSGSPTPSGTIGQIVALADKIDTLTGIFSVGLIPTGEKDPYGLRRAAIGSLRIIIENDLELDANELITVSLGTFHHLQSHADAHKDHHLIVDFIFDRLRGYCLDKGFAPDEFDAVMAVSPTQPLDFMKRLQAVKAFRKLPEAESLAAANKRIRNILKKSETVVTDDVGQYHDWVEAEERDLYHVLTRSTDDIGNNLAKKDYQAVLSCLALTEPAINAFFDKVLVMCDDLELRAKRLALLKLLSEQFLQIADIAKLQS